MSMFSLSHQSHESAAITEMRRSTVVWVLSGPKSQLMTLVEYELTDVNAVIELHCLRASHQRHVARTRSCHDGARHILADQRPLKRISKIVSCRQVKAQVRNSYKTVIRQRSLSLFIVHRHSEQCHIRES